MKEAKHYIEGLREFCIFFSSFFFLSYGAVPGGDRQLN
jgi:hypothetical protein